MSKWKWQLDGKRIISSNSTALLTVFKFWILGISVIKGLQWKGTANYRLHVQEGCLPTFGPIRFKVCPFFHCKAPKVFTQVLPQLNLFIGKKIVHRYKPASEFKVDLPWNFLNTPC